MASLLGGTIGVTCENCRTPFSFELWSVVDTDERPDLAAKVVDASIRLFACPRCGTTVSSIDPLLVYRPRHGGVGAMLLATSSEDPQAHHDEGTPLANWVAREVGADSKDVGIVVTPWQMLPALMQRDVGRDLETPDALLDAPPALGAWYRRVLGQLRADLGLSWVTELADGDLPAVDMAENVSIGACPHCGRASTGQVPCIVTDRPGLAGSLRNETFFRYTCPHCRRDIPLGFVFLVWRPRAAPRLLFGVRRGMSSDGVKEKTVWLLETLQAQLGNRFREEWLDQMVMLPHDELADRLAAPPTGR